MDVRIRPIADDEFERFVYAVETAFGGRGRPEDVARERTVAELDRCLAAVDGGELVGCAAAVSFEMTVPGATAPTAGVTAVGVRPTHRRRGINTALMRRQLDDVRDRGEPLAALFASEGGIYGRFGYGMAAFGCPIRIETGHAAFTRGHAPAGRVRLLGREEALAAFLPVYDQARLGRPGMMRMDGRWLDYRFDESHTHGSDPGAMFYAVHEGEDRVDGYAAYRVRHDWTHDHRNNEVRVQDVQALTPAANADLWRYLFDIDLMDVVTAWNRPADDPLLLLLVEPDRLNLRLADGLWVRLVDVSTALEARAYAAEGRLRLEVRDPFCQWNEGRYELETSSAGASCRRTDAEADLAVTVNDVAAAYLGGVTFRQLHRAGRVQELRPGALARADGLFAWDPAPWSSFMF